MINNAGKSIYTPLLTLVLLCASVDIYSAEPEARDKPDFPTLKKEMTARLKKELACVEAAKDEQALRECRHRPGGRGFGEGRPSH